MTQTTPMTNANTAEQATDRGVLPLRGLQLIGVAGSETDRRALVRSARGRIETVRVGDALRQGTVIAIGEGRVRLERQGRTITLEMPERDRGTVRPAA